MSWIHGKGWIRGSPAQGGARNQSEANAGFSEQTWTKSLMAPAITAWVVVHAQPGTPALTERDRLVHQQHRRIGWCSVRISRVERWW